jgi:AraC-like DNA-binding protein
LTAQLLTTASESSIAAALGVEPTELQTRIETTYRKLGVANRLELFAHQLVGNSQPAFEQPEHQAMTLAEQSNSEAETLATNVRKLLDRDWGNGEIDQERVARRLGFSSRTLQRRLRKADTSFRELVDQARRDRAMVLLSMPDYDYTQIALHLGYEQVSSFNRAVKRWTNKTPSDVREELLQTP